MNRKIAAAAGLTGLMLLLSGAAGVPAEQNPPLPEETVEYFAIWNDELYQDGFVVDSTGREYSLDDFTEEQKEDIYCYSKEYVPVDIYLRTQEGHRADLFSNEHGLWKMVDKSGNLIGEGPFLQLWFSGDIWSNTGGNLVYPIFRDTQTALYGVLGEGFEVLLPAEFKSMEAIYGPFFSCETPDGDCQVWNAETGKMVWQVPAQEGGGYQRVLFYNGEIAAVHAKDGDYLFWIAGTEVQNQKKFMDISVQLNKELNPQYGVYEIAGLSCQEQGATRFLDTQGTEVFSVPEECLIRYISDNCFLIYGEEICYMTDKKGKNLLGEEKRYQYIFTTDNRPIGVYPYDGLYEGLFDVLSFDGRVLISKASSVYACGEHCAYVTRGFSTGLMDYEGNWIWKRSIFQTLMD